MEPELRSLLAYLDLIDRGGGTSPTSRGHSVHARRRFNYTGFIVSLYGIFESFVEDLAEFYIDATISLCTSLGSPPPNKITATFKARSLECLNRPNDPRYGKDRDESKLAEGLAEASGGNWSGVSGELFRLHTTNFSAKPLMQFLSDAALDDLLKRACSLNDMQTKLFSGSPIEATSSEHCYRHVCRNLDRIAETRNLAAHGKLRHLEDVETLRLWLLMIDLVSQGVQSAAFDELVRCASNDQRLRQFRSRNVFGPEKNILIAYGLENEFKPVKIDNSTIVIGWRATAPHARWSPVASLELKNTPVKCVQISATTGAGVGVRFRGDTDHQYFVVHDEVWRRAGIPLTHAGSLSVVA